MKHIVKLFTFLLLSSVVLVGCKKDNTDTGTVKKTTITLKASLGVDTKVNFEDLAVDGIKTTWSENDAIAVYNSDDNKDLVGYFVLSAGTGTKNATFIGDAPLVSGKKYMVIYPANDSFAYDYNYGNRHLGGFYQDMSNPTKHLDNVCFMTGDFIYNNGNALNNFSLKPTHSIFTINLKKPNLTDTEIGGVPIKVSLTSSIDESYQTNVSLDPSTNWDNDIVVYVAAQHSEAIERNLTVTVLTTGYKVFSQTIKTSKEHKAGARYTVNVDALIGATNYTFNTTDFKASDAPTNLDTWVFSSDSPTPNLSKLKEALLNAETSNRLINVVLLNAEVIPSDVFTNISSLYSISMPMLKEVSDGTFRNCSNLNQISLPLTTTIGSSAFYSNKNLTSVYLPIVETIGDFAFYECSSMRHFSAPNLNSIDNAALSDCKGLVTLEIGTLKTITNFGRAGSPVLTEIDLSKIVLKTNSGTPNITTNEWTITNGTDDKEYGPFAKIIKTN